MGHQWPNALKESAYNPRVADCKTNLGGLDNCNYDLVGKILNHIYPGLVVDGTQADWSSNGKFYAIDQTPYSANNSQLNDYGFVYIPDACLGANCPLHVWFHGCDMSPQLFGSYGPRVTGWLEYSSANRGVVLFPSAHNDRPPFSHCWDFTYDDETDHPQILAVRKMLQALYNIDVFTGKVEDFDALFEVTARKRFIIPTQDHNAPVTTEDIAIIDEDDHFQKTQNEWIYIVVSEYYQIVLFLNLLNILFYFQTGQPMSDAKRGQNLTYDKLKEKGFTE